MQATVCLQASENLTQRAISAHYLDGLFTAQIYNCRCDCCLVAKLCLTLCNPIDYNPPGFSVLEIFQARILEWFAISFSRRSS